MILLDTHVALWLDQAPDRIGRSAHALIKADPRVCFSAVLTVESAIKQMLGRWHLPLDLADRLTAAGLEDLPLTSAHAAAIFELPELVRHDPFDRLYAAQALAESALLLTSDRRLLSIGRDWIVNARD